VPNDAGLASRALSGSRANSSAHARATAIVTEHVDAVWRTLRRLGLRPSELDDGVQQVFLVLSRRLEQIEPGRERAYLLGVALRVATDYRRSQRRRPEDATESAALEQRPHDGVSPENLLDEKRRLELLDELIGQLPEELASVFVLHELEELTRTEISRLLALPAGTVASRLRRAREQFERLCKELESSDDRTP
jgi:RNA polymerase sigma-70 factor (ECF subfamily)